MPRGIYTRTEKIRNAIRASRLGTKATSETRKKLSALAKARAQSPIWRKKISDKTLQAMRRPEVRRKHLAGLRSAREKYGVNFKGGKGQSPTEFINRMAKIFKPLGYVQEFAVGGLGRRGNYLVDFALPNEKVAIEFDGPKHKGRAQMVLDKKKTEKLKSLGWKVIRVAHD